jgi:hypothetical protein
MGCLVTTSTETVYMINESIQEIAQFEVRTPAPSESIIKHLFSIPFTIKDMIVNSQKVMATTEWRRGDTVRAHWKSDVNFSLTDYLVKGYTLKRVADAKTSEGLLAGAQADSIEVAEHIERS